MATNTAVEAIIKAIVVALKWAYPPSQVDNESYAPNLLKHREVADEEAPEKLLQLCDELILVVRVELPKAAFHSNVSVEEIRGYVTLVLKKLGKTVPDKLDYEAAYQLMMAIGAHVEDSQNNEWYVDFGKYLGRRMTIWYLDQSGFESARYVLNGYRLRYKDEVPLGIGALQLVLESFSCS